MSAERVAILGAGPMGLAAAYQLARDGLKPVVYEADDRVGGMTASFDFSGEFLERYYHFHCTSDEAFFSLLDELDLAEKIHWVPTHMGYWYKGKVQSWGDPISLMKFRGAGLIPKIRYGLHAFSAVKRNDGKSLDQMEATEWIKRWVGKEAYEIWWRRLFDYKFYQYAQDLSAAWIWSRIRRVGRSRYSIFQEKLGYLEGGSDTFLQAMCSYIKSRGGEIHLGCPVKKVCIESGKVKGIEVEEGYTSFSRVISTIPIPCVPGIMPGLPYDILEKLNALPYIAVVCVIAKLSSPVTENFWLNTNDPEMDIPGIVEYTNLRPLDWHIVYVPFYMPGDHPKYAQSDDVFVQKVRRYLKKINPALADKDFLSMNVSRYLYAQPVCGPRYLERLPSVSLPVKGLWAADTSYYYPEDRGVSESIQFGRQLAKKVLI
jgi:protoporphyrinogen oxidase